MRTVLILLFFITSRVISVNAQETLEHYIQEGLDNNLTIIQKNLSLQKAMNTLQIARNMYLPSISFDVTYTTANGGRAIDFPVGDMLNPVYATLNQLTQSQLFPQIQNEKINFLPRNYYDARIRAAVPIINTDIRHNKTVNEKLMILKENEVEIYKRELIKDIKQAYYNYLSASDAVSLYENTVELAQEGKRVNEKKLEAGNGLHAYVIRADTEIAQNEAKLIEAKQQLLNAQYYFNALLNREAQSPVATDEVNNLGSIWVNNTTEVSISGREELDALTQQIEIQETLVKMNKQVFVPKLSAFIDVGSQAENLRVNRDAQYVMAGAQLSFPIFEGNRNKLKIKESQIAVAEAQNQLTQAKQQLELSASVARNDVTSAIANYRTAKKQVESAATYQRLIQRGFNEGVNSYIETVDARSQFTAARLAEKIALYRVLSTLANLERETATYPLKSK